LRLRKSSMTFSSASLSACEVVEVAATAAGVTGFRADIAGARGGGANGAVAVAWASSSGPAAAVFCNFLSDGLGAAGAMAAVVAGTTLRAIGRGFGSGTFGPAWAGIENAAASARHVAKAVERKAAARTLRVTAFSRGESFKLTCPSPIWLNMWTKY
jgi:hypothetical protein